LIDHYEPVILTAQDYYPFGMISRAALPNNGQTYRFGFNGKENDNGVKGLGNQVDYGMRVQDPRIGRFLSVDPLHTKYPALTPYQFASNSPIQGIDLDGREIYHYMLLLNKQGKPYLKYLGVQTRELAWWEIYDKHQPAYSFPNANGDRIKSKTIRVWLPQNNNDDNYDLGKYSDRLDFNSFKAFQDWQAAGLPQEPPKPVAPEVEKKADLMTIVMINQMYFNYDLSDGHFDFDAPPDVSKLFSTPEPSLAESILFKALKRQGFTSGDKIPSGFKETWMEIINMKFEYMRAILPILKVKTFLE
jgi:RHS repeat-associated protein